jgi:hypothetical protein
MLIQMTDLQARAGRASEPGPYVLAAREFERIAALLRRTGDRARTPFAAKLEDLAGKIRLAG